MVSGLKVDGIARCRCRKWWEVLTPGVVHGVESSHVWRPAFSFPGHQAVVHDLLDFFSEVIHGREPYVVGINGRQMRGEQVDNACSFW